MTGPYTRHAAAALAMIAVLALAGPAPATHEPVPAAEAGRLSPEQLRGLLAGRVQVKIRLAGRFAGDLLVRRFTADGRWTGCHINRQGKVWRQTGGWHVGADSCGRGKLLAHRLHKPGFEHHINPAVIHYDPDTGRFLWRVWPTGHDRPRDLSKEARAWIDWNEGWLQDRWPQSAVDKCPDLDLDGVPKDKRQTAATFGGVHRQTPDAPLRGLARLLPPVPPDF